MNQSGKSHDGIELDLIDLSSINGMVISETKDRPILDLILEKIKETDSFLSFSRQIDEINKILKMQYASTEEIAEVLLKDLTLTSKLLKLANSSFYCQFNQKGIATVSEALILLGTDLIQQTAASLKLFEFMQQLSTNQKLKEKTLGCFMRSIIARDLAFSEGLDNFEEFQICAMFFDIGEYLILFLFPKKHKEIEQIVRTDFLNKEAASRSILGMSYSKIGREIAAQWGIPKKIIQTIKPVYLFSIPLRDITDSQYKRYASSFANELTELNWNLSKKNMGNKLNKIVERYGNIFKIDISSARELFISSREKIVEHANLLNIRLTTMP